MNDSAATRHDPVRDDTVIAAASAAEQRTRLLLDARRARRGKVTVIVAANRCQRPDGRRHYAIADVW